MINITFKKFIMLVSGFILLALLSSCTNNKEHRNNRNFTESSKQERLISYSKELLEEDCFDPDGGGWINLVAHSVFAKPGFILLIGGIMLIILSRLLPSKYWKKGIE